MHLILLGAPGSGKGTQARRLAEHFGIEHISTGDMLRAAIAACSDLGIVVESYLKKGRLVPDHHVTSLVEERLDSATIARGFVMDGYPRTHNQIAAFEQCMAQKGFSLDATLFIEVPDETVIARINGRRIDPRTGRIYNLHLASQAPPAEIAGRLEQREDDRVELMRERLSIYHEKIAPVIAHYEAKKLLVRIEGTRAPEAVSRSIRRRLESMVPGD